MIDVDALQAAADACANRQMIEVERVPNLGIRALLVATFLQGWTYAKRSEADRLKAALRKIQQWDCLNPPRPELLADLPWLKRLVDEALTSNDGGDKHG